MAWHRPGDIMWTNAGILVIGTSGTNFSEISIKIRIFSFTKMDFKVLSAKWWTLCLGLNVLNILLPLISGRFRLLSAYWRDHFPDSPFTVSVIAIRMKKKGCTYIPSTRPLLTWEFQRPLLLTWFKYIDRNFIHYKLWVEITYSFPNFNGATLLDMWLTYPCWVQR